MKIKVVYIKDEETVPYYNEPDMIDIVLDEDGQLYTHISNRSATFASAVYIHQISNMLSGLGINNMLDDIAHI